MPGNICSFRVLGQRLAAFEGRYSNTKQWTSKFFLIYGNGWKYPANEMQIKDYPVTTKWGHVPEDKHLSLVLTSSQQNRMNLVHKWAKDHDRDGLWSEDPSDLNIERF